MRILPFLPALLALALWSCGGAPPSAREAHRLMAQGDYPGAERIADRELEHAPEDPTYWRIKVQAAMGSGDARRAVQLYQRWFESRRRHDDRTLASLAKTVLWQGLRVPAADVQVEAIRVIEEREIEDLAQEVIDRVAADDDRIAAAAASAVLRVHPYAPRVLTDLLKSSDARARAIAVEGIGRKVGDHARGDLVRMLADPDPGVRRAAVRAVANFGDQRDTDQLIAVARSDADGTVRATALQSLGRGDRRGTAELARAALGDAYLGARLAAVSLLGRTGASGRGALGELLASDDLFIAVRAAQELGKHAGPAAAAPIERALGATEWSLRAAAVNAIPRALGPDAARRLLERPLADPRTEVRLAAARALIQLGDKDRASRELIAALASDDEDDRLQAAIDLVRLDDPHGLQTLIELLTQSQNATIRAGAIRAHLQARMPTLPLVLALADDSITNRIIAADVILQVVR